MPDKEENINVSTKQETTEVVTPPGQSNEGGRRLSSIFDAIVEGKEDGKTTQEVIAAQPKIVEEKQEKPAEKPADKPAEKKEDKPAIPEVKTEESELSKKLNETQEKKGKTEEELSREKLLEATEVKEEVKPEVKTKPEDEVPEEELKVLPHDKPKTAKRIQALLRKIDTVNEEVTKTKAEATEKASKLAELEKKLGEVKTSDPETEAKVKEQLDELAMYRRRYELDKDPEVKTKFDARVEAAEESITKTLVRNNAGEPLLKLIKEEGGWNKFSESGRLVSVSDGDGGTKQVTSAELADNILQALKLGDRKAVEAAMLEQVQTKRDKERYFKEQQDTAVEFFKKREDEQTRQSSEYQKQVEAAKKTIQDFEEKTMQADWLKDKVVDPKATLAEKAAVEEYNKYNAQLRSVFKKSIGTKDLNELLSIVADSVRFYDERRTSSTLKRENDKLKADLAAKQAEIDKFKSGSRSVPKAGSISTSPADNGYRDEPPKGISDAFDRLARGEKLGVGDRDDD